MSRWKSLPETLDPRVRQLVVQLRQLKDHSGLSLAALAAKTATSTSSWARYLNGRALPPRQAVEALARVTNSPPEPLLALWEVASRPLDAPPAAPPDATAEDAAGRGHGDESGNEAGNGVGARDADGNGNGAGWQGRDTVGPAATRAAHPPRPRRVPLLPALVVLVAAAAIALLFLRPWDASESEESATPAGAATEPPSPAPSTTGASPTTYPCQFYQHEGRRYAGHSTTLTQLFELDSYGEPVAEVQCLLDFHGFSPGAIDGIIGPNTETAIKSFQRDRGLDADGIVGPQTWEALRRV